ncbi:efflux RND transporter periplasmic adaptor subunit [Flavobacterium sp. KACC 22761]|uniref:efflux RND transporter periplasmic adaptor subunit n=1 Tax=Flavobacterium sp. KACC 22761 TaxID=3092665 RepID=UPI002A75F4CD|nr:efflux RND transporter periplasmic adaptor subunit [Flavobacterium sp. KACC 22761]WPO77878.1 efflux RND transporter periplasmic adaptor subunit [Flavobacterium sp. KACC 22761]
MKHLIKYSGIIVIFLCACSGKENKQDQAVNNMPQVTNNGKTIVFPSDSTVVFFETESIGNSVLNNQIMAPAKVSATVMKSQEGASQNIILFENPDLAASYTQLIQHLANVNQIQNKNIKQKQIEVDRAKDLLAHGAATGKDLLEAQTALSVEQTNLANEKAALIEFETNLKAGGFEPEALKKAKAGTSFIICDIPENQISRIKSGDNCTVQFTAFPNEKFSGKIDDIADMIDQSTRMVKLRISLNNASGKFKAGMFATVSFGVSEGDNISIDKNSLVTVQAKNYVFVKKGNKEFERTEVTIGNQIGDRIVVYSGLTNGDAIAVKGVMQLKGLSFGY